MKADWASDDAERTEILRRVAEIEEKSLGDLPAAVATYRSLLEANDEDPTTLAELERLYERLGQHRERIDIMRRRLELATDAESRRDIRFRMAVILERELGDVDEAISTVLAILDENPDNVAALEMLASLYERKGAVTERLEVLERRLQLADRGRRPGGDPARDGPAARGAAGPPAGRPRSLARGARPAADRSAGPRADRGPPRPTARIPSAWWPPRCSSRSTSGPGSGPSWPGWSSSTSPPTRTPATG